MSDSNQLELHGSGYDIRGDASSFAGSGLGTYRSAYNNSVGVDEEARKPPLNCILYVEGVAVAFAEPIHGQQSRAVTANGHATAPHAAGHHAPGECDCVCRTVHS